MNRNRQNPGNLWLRTFVVFVGVLGFLRLAAAADPDLEDVFARRPVVTSRSGSARGNNTGATVEPFEPRHGGKVGGHSVWISWTAPATGIATIDTGGSSFDTLLSVYSIDPSNPSKPVLDRLREVARADDNGSSLASVVQFGVQSGQTYEIAVDGFNGATGDIRLRWDLLASDSPPPVILQLPSDRSLRAGDTVVLTVDYQAGKDVKLAWLFNGDDLPGNETATLTIPNFQAGNVGRYQLRLTAGGIRFTSDPIELQINSEGEIFTLARDKLFDALDSPLVGRGDDPDRRPGPAAGRRLAAIGVARGYNGVQIFNTLFATREAGEPVHCGVPGGGSYWLAYQAPAAGSLTLDTEGSSFDTVLAVYTYEAPLLGYPSLIPVACDNNGGADGLTSRLEFETQSGRSYLIAVDGAHGARGTARLSYRLTTAPAVTAPIVKSSPVGRTSIQGQSTTFEVVADGTAPLGFQWFKDGTLIGGAVAPTLALANVQPADAGSYFVRVSNAAGSVDTPAATLTVLVPPKIVQSPSGRTLVQGQSTTFEVTAEGSAPLDYQWFKDGVAIRGAIAPTLVLANVQPADAGSYFVRVSNAAGTVDSPAVALTVLVPPKIVQSPSGRTLVQGQATTFEVTAEGSAPLDYQWFKDGVAIRGAIAPTLVLANVQPADAGSYFVRVSNAAGTVESPAVALTVLVPPKIVQSPSGRTLVQGQATTFEVTAGGSAPLDYQWFKDGVAIRGAIAPTLVLANVQPADAGSYFVRVSNAAGTVESPAVALTVLVPPKIVQSPSGRTLVQGQATTFEVTAEGSAPLDYQWFKDGTAIRGAVVSTLALANVQAADAGSYFVRVSNAAGSVDSPAVALTVLVPPKIVQAPSGRTLVQGQSTTFEVTAEGSAPLDYLWFKDGTAIRGAVTPTLALANVQAADAGSYFVRVSNAAGTADGPAVALTVLVPPKIVQSPSGLTVSVGKSALLAVEVEGTGPFTYRWSRDGKLLVDESGPRIQRAAVRPIDAGVYRVVVSNAAGEVASEPAALGVTVTTAIAFDAADGSVTLRVPVSPGLSYTVESRAPVVDAAWLPLISGVSDGDWVNVRVPIGGTSSGLLRVIVRTPPAAQAGRSPVPKGNPQ